MSADLVGNAKHTKAQRSVDDDLAGGGCSYLDAEQKPRLTLEAENDLRQFLKLVCGDKWSKPRRKGFNDVHRVVEKLEAIGVHDVTELLHRVTTRTINEDLAREGYSRFSRDTLDNIRDKGSFIRALEHLNETQYRPIGVFAPVPQMLSGTNLRYQAMRGGGGGTKASLSCPRPATHSGGKRRGSSRAGSPTASSAAPTRAESPTASTLLESSQQDSVYIHCDDPAQRPKLRHSKAKRTHAREDLDARPLGMSPMPSLVNRSPDASGSTAPPGYDIAVTKTPTSPGDTVPPTPSRSRGLTEHSSSRPRLQSGDSDEARDRGSPPPQRHTPNCSVPETPARGQQRLNTAPDRFGKSGSDTPRTFARLHKASQQMREAHRTASWTSLNSHNDSLVTHGEAMLREHKNTEDRKRIHQTMACEGASSPLRQHVAKNIRQRLKEERERDDQLTLDQVEIQQRGINITKHIDAMRNTRRELQLIKRNAFEEEVPVKAPQFDLEVFPRSKSHGQLEPLTTLSVPDKLKRGSVSRG